MLGPVTHLICFVTHFAGMMCTSVPLSTAINNMLLGFYSHFKIAMEIIKHHLSLPVLVEELTSWISLQSF